MTRPLDPEPDDLAPLPSEERAPSGDRMEREIRAILGGDGALAQQADHYEERAQQLEMAELVAEALTGGTHAVVEAGTGTGKTLAYLVPALLSGKRIVVSTATKALQEQLVEKDLPLLQKLGAKFRFAVMKGRSNYLCLLRQEQFDAQPVFVSSDERELYRRLRTWARTTETGDRAELDLPDHYVAWRDVSSTTETCLGQDCPRYQQCHVTRMRQKAQEADIIVVNHHLFFADLALRQSPAAKGGAEVIPRAEGVVFDEAHNLEEIATEFFGAQISNYRFFDLCRDLDRTAKVRGSWPRERVLRCTQSVGRAVDSYFRAVAALAPLDQARQTRPPPVRPHAPRIEAPREPPPRSLSLFETPSADGPRETSATDDEVLDRAIVLEGPAADGDDLDERRETRWTLAPGALEPAKPMLLALLGELGHLESLLDEIGKEQEDPEVEGYKRRCDEGRAALSMFVDQNDASLVYWAEVRGRGVFLRASPVDVAGYLRRALFEQPQPVVMTSATLATGGDTAFFRRRVGLRLGHEDVRPTREGILSSPFDYPRQAALYVPRHLPEPTDPQFIDKSIDEIAALIALARGRTFVLFTSLRAMNETYRRLGPRIPYRTLVQGQKPKGAIIREFREEPSVLFATQSFWEGVDIQGDALSMVVIDKLPFASPGDPLVAARLQAITDRGGSPFGEYQLPAAAIALKQGFGRLIRSRQDTGAVAILDRRLWTKGYGSYFRRSLPNCRTFDRFPDLKLWWKDTRKDES